MRDVLEEGDIGFVIEADGTLHSLVPESGLSNDQLMGLGELLRVLDKLLQQKFVSPELDDESPN